jgi:uncharacterized protein
VPSRRPDHEVRVPVMRQEWRDVVFLHWPYPRAAVARQVPRGLSIHTYKGQAWVALTSFQVAACSLGPAPPLSAWSFPETNLRTYVVGPDGQDGIWFLDIDAGSLPVAVGARLGVGAPYHWADMSVRRSGPSVRYECRRRGPVDAGHDIEIRVGDPVADADRAGLVDWLTGRWRSWTALAGVAVCSPVAHEPWPLRHAEVVTLEQDVFSPAGLAPPEGDPLAHYAPSASARFAPSRPYVRGLPGLPRSDRSGAEGAEPRAASPAGSPS